jgi:hypothetical protein
VPLLALVLFVPLVIIALMPLILVQRYRAGTARRLARPWLSTVALAAMLFSSLAFLIGAAVTSIWVPGAFTSALAGMAGGGLLGLAGLAMTRWESTARTLHYTPNRLTVLAVTLLVSARVIYGFWRAWSAAQSDGGETILGAFGVGGSLAAGAVVVGYYLVYSAGVRWRIRKWERRPLRAL